MKKKRNLKQLIYNEKQSEINGVTVIHRSVPLISIFIIVFILSLLMFVIGLMMGYGVLHSPFEIFNPKTWIHAFELTGADK